MTTTMRGEPEPLGKVEEAFYANFVIRRLVQVYGVPLASITTELMVHAAHDLSAVRYRAWLVHRRAGATLKDAGSAVTDESAPDVFKTLWGRELRLIPGVGPGAVAIVNENRRRARMEPLQTPCPEVPADAGAAE